MSDLFNLNGAEFSECGKYRYLLWRKWDESKPMVMFIGLNPSTANATKDDPTIRKVKGFAQRWGFGGVYMVNLFGIISSNPKVIIQSKDPIGEVTDHWMGIAAGRCHTVVFAWGVFKAAHTMGRAKAIIARYPDAICLRKTKDGHPEHPSRIGYMVKPVLFGKPMTYLDAIKYCKESRLADFPERMPHRPEPFCCSVKVPPEHGLDDCAWCMARNLAIKKHGYHVGNAMFPKPIHESL